MNTQYEENADMISGREDSEGKSAKRSLMEAYPSITWRIRGLSMCRVDDIFDMAAEVRERGEREGWTRMGKVVSDRDEPRQHFFFKRTNNCMQSVLLSFPLFVLYWIVFDFIIQRVH